MSLNRRPILLRAFAYCSSTLLLFSASSAAIANIADSVRAALKIRHHHQGGSDYTDTPGPVDYGSYPLVDPVYRGYFYSTDDINAFNVSDSVECGASQPPTAPSYVSGGDGDTGDNQSLIGRPAPLARNENGSGTGGGGGSGGLGCGVDYTLPAWLNGILASTNPSISSRQVNIGGDGSGGTGPANPGQASPTMGDPFPWEGQGPGGGSSACPGLVNTQTGNRLSAMPVVGWRIPGGMRLDLTLFHNSQDNVDIGWGQNWRSSFDFRVVYSGTYAKNVNKLTMTYPDGRRLVFTRTSTTSNRYYPPTGFYDMVFCAATTANGTPVLWTLRTKDQVLYSFNGAGYLINIADRYGNSIIVNHNSTGYLTSVADQQGNSLTFGSSTSYPAVITPHYTGVTATGGNVYLFTSTGHYYNQNMVVLRSVQWPSLGGQPATQELFGYDYSGAIILETARDGQAYRATYNATEQLTSFSYPVPFYTNPITQTGNQGALTYNYLYGSTATTLTDPYGKTVIDNYSGGTLRSVVDQALYSETYTWDNSYNLSQFKNERQYTSNFTFDQFGNMASAQDPRQTAANVSQQWTYNSYNDVLTAADCRGATTTINRDPNSGVVLNVKDGLGNILVTNTWNTNGELATTYSQGATTSVYYDSNYRPQSVVTPDNSYTIAYAGAGNLPNLPLSVTTGEGVTISLGLDSWGRPTSVTRSTDGKTASVVLDALNRATSSVDWSGRTTNFTLDALGRPSSVTNARNDTETYYWFDDQRLAGVLDGNSHLKSYQYTVRGEAKSLTMADGYTEQVQFDGDGDTTYYGNPATWMWYTFDNTDSQVAVTYPSGPGVSEVYDNDGRQTSLTDSSGTTGWVYDMADRLTNFNSAQGNIAYTYDQWGRRTQLDEGGGVKIQYAYTAQRLTSITKLPENEVTAFQYDGYGRVQKQSNSNGTYTNFGYDAIDRLVSLSHNNSSGAAFWSEAYNFDTNSNLSSKVVNGTTTSYSYDNIDQLLSESAPGYSALYSYDHNGNRTSRNVNSVNEVYSYDAGDKLLSRSSTNGTWSYGYDGGGRVYQITAPSGMTTIGYDYEDRVTSVSAPGKTTNSYGYNYFDARVSKTDSTGSHNVLRDGHDPVSPVLNDGAATYTPGVARHSGGATRVSHSDYLGTNSSETDASQTVQGTRSYDAFGNPVSTSGTPAGPFGYAGGFGYQEDQDTGLKLLGHRFYDPGSGRFLTRDSAGEGTNWYNYCRNKPTTWVDEDGAQAAPVLEPAPTGGLPPGWTVVEGGGGEATAAAAGGGEATAGASGAALVGEGAATVGAGSVAAVAVVAVGGWCLGRWIDDHTGISTAIAKALVNDPDELPADPECGRRRRNKPGKVQTEQGGAEHTSNASPSNKDQHDLSKARKKRDRRGGEKGDARRPYMFWWWKGKKKPKPVLGPPPMPTGN